MTVFRNFIFNFATFDTRALEGLSSITISHTAAFKLGGLFDILALFSISMVNP